MHALPRPAAATVPLAPALTPAGRLWLGEGAPGEDDVEAGVAARLRAAFERSTGEGLLRLGGAELDAALPPALAFFRELGRRHVAALCALPDLDALGAQATVPPPPDLPELTVHAPPFEGGDLLDAPRLEALWREVGAAFARACEGAAPSAALASLHPSWSVAGRVCFHLAEHREDPERPFAFLATFTTGRGRHGAAHRPLMDALADARGDQAALLRLLRPVHRAAGASPAVKALVESGRLFRPHALSADDAYALLLAVPACEAAGVAVRVPDFWRRRAKVQVVARVGEDAPAGLGAEAILDFSAALSLDGAPLSKKEWAALRARAAGLALVRGSWVEVDPARLAALLERFEAAKEAYAGGVGLLESLRLLAGTPGERLPDAAEAAELASVRPGRWLAAKLDALRGPDGLATELPRADELAATLRPYQAAGVRWLHLLHELGLGAVLADDMGLGKTVQVLGLLALLARRRPRPRSLLVVPASLVPNWRAEAARFAPGLSVKVAHPSAGEEAVTSAAEAKGADVLLTTYGMLQRSPWLSGMRFETAIVDEAQAVKNPAARQTRAVKAVKARVRIALTGTPVENRLGDLWSIFDFAVPGLLGSEASFAKLGKALRERGDHGPLRALVRPYLLRRRKTDPAIAPDLPARTEVTAYAKLAPEQAALYQERVDRLARELGTVDGMKRRGAVLAALTALKQIGNHPAHFLGEPTWEPARSGKLARLGELAETIAARREKALVFTQFREATGPLQRFLAGAFGRDGLVLHGGTSVKERKALVERFQRDEAVPFLVLTVKAGGVGLNLTAASHVIHFDRWWNPAVEDQATDRAHRIGQTRGVLVHKLVCKGTVEEKIDALVASKRKLAREVLDDGGAAAALTELSNEELLGLLRLDARSLAGEA